MKPTFLLTIYDSETGDDVAMIDAYTLEALEEKMKNIPTMIKNYEEQMVEEKELDLDDDDI